MEQLNYYRAQTEKELNKIEVLNELERKTKVPKFFMVVGASIILVFLIMANIAAAFITNLTGFLYPAYASFKAIESKGTEDDTLWLTYWVVYSFFNLLEFFSDWLLFWLPFYFLLKLVFLVYLFHPTYRGAVFIYSRFIRQFLGKYEKSIDRKASEVSKAASEAGAEATAGMEKLEKRT